MQIKEKNFEQYKSENEIQNRVSVLASELNEKYNGESPVFLIVLNGAFMFASDLIKQTNFPSTISFVKVRSYVGMKSGEIQKISGLDVEVKGRTVVVVEDIVDTGKTLEYIIAHLQEKEAKLIDICTFLFKPNSFQGSRLPDFIGFEISDEFVVGYGMDYDEHGRNLVDLYQLNESTSTI